MNLVLEPTKCKSLSICSGSSKIVEFQLNDGLISSISESSEKFLGSHISFSGKQSDILQMMTTHISGLPRLMLNVH